MKVSATAPGKLVLMGEYAVLENSPAIVAAVNRRAIISVERSGKNYSILDLPHLKASVPFVLDQTGLKLLVKPDPPLTVETVNRVASMLTRIITMETPAKNALHPIHLTIDSSDFFSSERSVKLGLGSSAAVTVGLLTAVRNYIHHARNNRYALMCDSYRLHNISQNQAGSGIDIAASVFGGVLRYRMGTHQSKYSPDVEQVSRPANLQMRFVWTGQPASTGTFLKNLADYKNGKRDEYNRSMRRLVHLAQSGCEAFEKSKTKTFLQTVERFFHCLEDLGRQSQVPIISNDHRRIARIVYENGGYYKPSGAGGGDFGIIFSANASLIDHIGKQVEKAGFFFPNLSVGVDGICNRPIEVA